MGNKPSIDVAGRPAAARKGLHFRFTKERSAATATVAAEGAGGPALQIKCPVEALLEAISLGVYTDAFLLAGYGSSNAADLAVLTTADLAQICAISKVPILPQHQSLILAASKQLAITLGILSYASATRHVDRTVAAAVAARGTLSSSPAAVAAAAGGGAASDATATRDQAGRAQLAADAVRSGSSSQQGCQQQSAGNAGADEQHENYQQQQQGRGSQQDDGRAAHSPCPLMNPFLCDSSGIDAASPDAARTAVAAAAAAEGGGDSAAAVPAAGCSSSNADSSRQGSGQQGVAVGDAGRSQPSICCATARSASRGSISVNDADANRPGSSSIGSKHASAAVASSKDEQRPVSSRSQRGADAAAAATSALTQAAMQLDRATMPECARQRQLQVQQQLAGAAGAACADAAQLSQDAAADGAAVHNCTAAAQADKHPGLHASAAASAQPMLPGLPENEPAKPQHMRLASAQHSMGQAVGTDTCSAVAGAYAAPNRELLCPAAQRTPEPICGEALICSAARAGMCAAAARADKRGATTCIGLGAAAAAFAAPDGSCWFQELEWDDFNPFLVDVLPAYQHSRVQDAAGDNGLGGFSTAAAERAYDEKEEDGVPFAEAAAAAVAAGRAELTGKAAAAVAAGACAAALDGPLTSQRAQLMRASSSRGVGGKRALSSSAVTAKLSALRKHGSAWGKLPAEVSCMSYAATASLKSKPLPALAGAASGQPKKQRAVQGPPGVLTVHASQLPQRPASKAHFSMLSVHGRHIGLCAEESAASAAAALQALAQQQANNQDLIQRLLHAPPAGPQQATGQDTSPMLEQSQSQLGYSVGYNIGVQDSALLLLKGSGGSAVAPVLAPSTNFVLVQQPPQLYAQYSHSSCFAPVGVSGGFEGSSTQQPQVFVLGPQGWPAAAGACQDSAGTSGSAKMSESLHQQRHGQQTWRAPSVAALSNRSARMQDALQAGAMLSGYAAVPAAHGQVLHHHQQDGYFLQQQRSNASVASSAAGQGPGRFCSAQSCLELGARAADVSNIVIMAKARAAARQQLLRNQQQQQLQVTPTTPVLGNRPLDEMAQGQAKGAAAMLAGKPMPAAAAASRPVRSAAAAGPAGMPASEAHVVAHPQNRSNTNTRPGVIGSAATAALHTTRIPAAAPASELSTGSAADASSLAAAVRDGDRVLQMLHEYKESSELCKAVKLRMMQLLHTAAAPGRKTAGAAQARSPAAAAAVASTVPAALADYSSAVSPNAAVHGKPNVLAEVHVQCTQAGVAVCAGGGRGGNAAAAEHGAVHGNNSCAGVLQAAGGGGVHDAQRAAASGSALRAQAYGYVADPANADAPEQRIRAAGDQASTAMQPGYQPKVHIQHIVQSDQQQKLAALHRRPNHKAALSSSSYLSAPAGNLCADGTAATDAAQDAQTGKHTAVRQLWQDDCPAGAATPVGDGAHAAPNAAAAAAAAPTAGAVISGAALQSAAEVLAATGLPPLVRGQCKKGSSVAALVAAVAGQRLRPA